MSESAKKWMITTPKFVLCIYCKLCGVINKLDLEFHLKYIKPSLAFSLAQGHITKYSPFSSTQSNINASQKNPKRQMLTVTPPYRFQYICTMLLFYCKGSPLFLLLTRSGRGGNDDIGEIFLTNCADCECI